MSNRNTSFCENEKSENEDIKKVTLEKFRYGLNSLPIMQVIPGAQNLINNVLAELEAHPLLDESASSLCKEYLDNQNESKSIEQNPICRDTLNRKVTLEKFRYVLNSLPVIQIIPGSPKIINDVLAELKTELPFDESASLCRESLNQNKAKSIEKNPACRYIPKKAKIALSQKFRCVLNSLPIMQVIPGAQNLIKNVMAELEAHPLLNEPTLLLYEEYLNNQKKSKTMEQNPDFRNTPKREDILEKFRYVLNSLPIMQVIPGPQKLINDVLAALETEPFFDESASLCTCLHNPNRLKERKLEKISYNIRHVPKTFEKTYFQKHLDHLRSLPCLQSNHHSEEIIKYLMAKYRADPGVNKHILSLWRKYVITQLERRNVDQIPDV